MNVEYTGRQYEITPAVRKQIEHGLTKLTKILGSNFETHVILSVEKHRCKAEITITSRNTPIVCAAEAGDMTAAITCPVLVLRGAESGVLQSDTISRMRDRGPRMEVIELPGVGHAPSLMQVDQIEAVRRFLVAK